MKKFRIEFTPNNIMTLRLSMHVVNSKKYKSLNHDETSAAIDCIDRFQSVLSAMKDELNKQVLITHPIG